MKETAVRGSEQERGAEGGIGTVLIVEDDKGVRDLIRQVLVEEGYKVRLMASGVDALAVADFEALSVVVFDFQLDDMDGMEFYERLRERSATVPAVLCSGWGDTEERASAMGLPYVKKPFDLDEFVAVVNAACQGIARLP